MSIIKQMNTFDHSVMVDYTDDLTSQILQNYFDWENIYEF